METRKKKSSESSCPAPCPPMTKEQLRTCMLYDFQCGLKPGESFERMRKGLGSDAPCYATVARWFSQFSRGKFSVSDDPREGRPKTATHDDNVAAVKAAVDADDRATLVELEETLGINAMSISRILKEKLGYTKTSDRWVPDLLSGEQKTARANFEKSRKITKMRVRHP